jgi:hypothetical protein
LEYTVNLWELLTGKISAEKQKKIRKDVRGVKKRRNNDIRQQAVDQRFDDAQADVEAANKKKPGDK